MSLSRAVGLAAMLVGVAAAQHDDQPSSSVATGFVDKTIRVGENEHRYVVYVPKQYRAEQRWPLLMFLNGMGECGTDGKRQVGVGLGPAIRKAPERWPFVVVFPQKPDRGSQWREHDALVMATLAAAEQEYTIDAKRRFLTGLSQGGSGTWDLGAQHADVWAAIAPVCGYTFGKPAELAASLKAMPIWAFHGEDDRTVPLKASLALVAAVDAAGGAAVLTTYPNTAHNSWDQAYRGSSLAEWLRVHGRGHGEMHALASPERVAGALTIRLGNTAAAGRDVESLSIGRATTWQVEQQVTNASGAATEPTRTKLDDAAGARLLAESLRALIAAGGYDPATVTTPGAPENGDYVSFHYVHGAGDVAAPARFLAVAAAPAPLLAAVREVADRLRRAGR